MKLLTQVLPFAAMASAFVIVEPEAMAQVPMEAKSRTVVDKALDSALELYDAIDEKFSSVVKSSQHAFDDCMHSIADSLEDATAILEDKYDDWTERFKSEYDAEDLNPPHRRPGHGHATNLTIYQLIKGSKYSTKIASLIDDYPEIVKALNSTKANYTIFVPVDKAFENIPEHGEKPPKELIEKVLLYHVVPDVYTAGRILGLHTLPTLLKGEHLSSDPESTPQRLAFKLGFTGLYVDNYSKVFVPNIFAKNGVIHAVDHILIPPPSIASIISFSPTAFSTYALAAQQTELQSPPHLGATLFAPVNFAWKKLGFKVNAFLFSEHGKKYLKAILEYSAVSNQTLYSDHFYGPESEDTLTRSGTFHVDLPTLLHGKTIGVDIARWGGLIEVKVNAFTRVIFQDAVARDGVLQAVGSVLIPPRHVNGEEVHYQGEQLTVEELKERLDPFVSNDGEDAGLEL